MAKKKLKPERTQRTDAERRARQSERLSRLLQVLRHIMGPGRWDAEALARELEVSPRTIHRIMQTLALASVPWFYCKESGCYRIRPGFKFSALASGEQKKLGDPTVILSTARQLIEDGERFMNTLRQFYAALNTEAKPEDSDMPR